MTYGMFAIDGVYRLRFALARTNVIRHFQFALVLPFWSRRVRLHFDFTAAVSAYKHVYCTTRDIESRRTVFRRYNVVYVRVCLGTPPCLCFGFSYLLFGCCKVFRVYYRASRSHIRCLIVILLMCTVLNTDVKLQLYLKQ